MSAAARRMTKAIASELLPADGARQVVARINTTAVDREGDVVLPSGAARCGSQFIVRTAAVAEARSPASRRVNFLSTTTSWGRAKCDLQGWG